MKRRIAIANFKGGVGKSTCAMMLIDKLAAKGNKVLALDFDAQSNLSLMLCGTAGMKTIYAERQTIVDLIHALLENNDNIESTKIVQANRSDVKFPPSGKVDIIVAHPDLRRLEYKLYESHFSKTGGTQNFDTWFADRLNDFLNSVARYYDYIIIDTSPGLSFLGETAMRICPDILSPVIPDHISRLALESFARDILPKTEPIYGERKHIAVISKFQANIPEMSSEKELIKGNHRFTTIEREIPQSASVLKATRYKKGKNRRAYNSKYVSALRNPAEDLYEEYKD